MKHTLAIPSVIFLTVVALLNFEPVIATTFVAQKEQKPFKREEQFPDGKQTGFAMFAPADRRNMVTHTFTAEYDTVWSAVKVSTEKFANIGKRPVTVDETNRRIRNSNIPQTQTQSRRIGAPRTLIQQDWVDEVSTEVIQISPKQTKVIIIRKVMELETDGRRTVWAPRFSNSKIERWLLTQIEDQLKNPNSSTQKGHDADPEPSKEILNNSTIISMVQARLSEDLIKEKIRSTPCSFDISARGLIQLKQGGVNDNIIRFMMSAACQPQ